MLAPRRLVADEPAVGQRRGLPMSWSSAARRTIGWPPGARRPSRSVWSQRSSPGILFWGTPRCAASSGRTASRSPGLGSSRSPTDGCGRPRAAAELGAIRSPERCASSGAPARDRGQRRRLDLEAERRREPDRAEHPQRVLLEARARDRRPPAGVAPRRGRATAERVDERRRSSRLGAPGDRVDGEVAPRQVGLERRRRTRPDAAGGSRRSRGRSGTS